MNFFSCQMPLRNTLTQRENHEVSPLHPGASICCLAAVLLVCAVVQESGATDGVTEPNQINCKWDHCAHICESVWFCLSSQCQSSSVQTAYSLFSEQLSQAGASVFLCGWIIKLRIIIQIKGRFCRFWQFCGGQTVDGWNLNIISLKVGDWKIWHFL